MQKITPKIFNPCASDGHAIWVKRDLLRPEISENSFEVRSTGIGAIA